MDLMNNLVTAVGEVALILVGLVTLGLIVFGLLGLAWGWWGDRHSPRPALRLFVGKESAGGSREILTLCLQFEVYPVGRGTWRWRLRHRGRVIAEASEDYASSAAAHQAVADVRAGARTARVENRPQKED